MVPVLEALGPDEVGLEEMEGTADVEAANDHRSHRTNLVLKVGTDVEAVEELDKTKA